MQRRSSLGAVLALAVLIVPATVVAAKKSVEAEARWNAKISRDDRILHALNRLTFGPRLEDVEHVRKAGLKKWIDRQLHPSSIAENPKLEAKLKPLDTLAMTTEELALNYPPPRHVKSFAQGRGAKIDSGRRAALFSVAPQRVIAHDLTEAKLQRAIYSNRQLEVVLTDFWFNHFNVYLDKGADRYLVTSYERDAIRPHVLGKFGDMLRATAEHPAMLFYLDNWQSVDPKAVENVGRRRAAPAGRARGLNENYARELLELHTLGVEGGYTQHDVIDVARCFTGWSIKNPRQGGGFQFNDRVHDKGPKTVLGVNIPAGGGREDGLKVLEIIARHPSTARFISYKLAQRFVADNPPESLVTRMAATFRKSDGDLRAVLRTMLDSKEFWSLAAYRAKMKSPLEMVASAVRALDARVDSVWALAGQLNTLGQPLYRKQEPTGYSNTSEDWVNSAALLGRMNFALALTGNKIPGVRIAQDASEQAAVIGGPDFQRR